MLEKLLSLNFFDYLDLIHKPKQMRRKFKTMGIFQCTHWEELLQSVSDFIFSRNCGCTPRGVTGVKRPEIL